MPQESSNVTPEHRTQSPGLVQGLEATATKAVEVIDFVPGMTGQTTYRSPEDTVRVINDDLRNRDPSKPFPTVAAGDMIRHP